MKRLSQLLLTLITISLFSAATAQTGKITFSGTIADSTTKKVLAGATITVAAKGDTLRTMADEKGAFHFNVQEGVYNLRVEYIGYAARQLQVNVNSNTSAVQVIMAPESKSLGAVTVTGSKPFIVQKTDKITLNVAQSPVAAGDNIYEVVKRAPGMQDQGSLKFRGKTVTVLMDGRQLNMSADDLKNFLSAMPANTVERIEVLPNPSAKYDAQGGAVVNIISAKNKNLGLNGIANLGMGAGKYVRYNSGISLNYRNTKMNLYGSYDYLHTKTWNSLKAERNLFANSVIYDQQQGQNTNNNHVFKAGLDYEINKKSSWGILVKGTAGFRKKNTDGTTVNSYGDNNDSSSTVAQAGKSSITTPAVNLYYKTKVGSKGAELILNADYFRYNKEWKDDFTTRYFDPKGAEYMNPYLLRDNSPGNNTIRSFTADYSFALKSIRFETGIKTVFTTTDNDIIWEQNNGNGWEKDANKSNRFVYDENINAGYLSAKSSWKKFDWQLGVRAEQTNTKGNSITLNKISKNSYFNLFPSVDLGYNQSEDQQFSLAYRRKIERFGFNIVNPFIIYQNQYAYSQGNPDIKPTYSDNFEAGWSYKNEWMASLSYSHYTDVMMDVYKKDPVTGAMISTYDNLNGADQADLNVSYTRSFFNNRFTTSNTIGGLYAAYKATGQAKLSQSAFTYYFSSQNIVTLAKGFRAEVSMNYYSPLVLTPYHFKAQYSVNAGVSKTMLKNKGTLTLNVSDLFNTARQRYTVETESVRSVNNSKQESRFVKLTFSWKFGNSQVKASKSRRSGIDEVQRRMNN
ncbi:MAG: outer membrane beta-barrel family protein [Chitinophagaceae bacterium]